MFLNPGCRRLFIAIWNSNHAIDDNFKILLNNNELGTIDNNQNQCTGRIFCDDTSIELIDGMTCDVGGSFALQSTLEIGDTLINGSNTLRIESIQDNNNGNFGKVWIGWTKCVGDNTAKVCELLVDSTYSFADGVGNGQNYNFNYP